MAIVSQSAIKHGFFGFLSKINGKSRRAGRVFMQNKANSPSVQMVVRSITTTDYDEICCLTFVKNKPNSNPIRGKTKPNQANLPQQQKMNASFYFRKDYGKMLWHWSQEKQSQSKPNKSSTGLRTGPIKPNFKTAPTPKGVEQKRGRAGKWLVSGVNQSLTFGPGSCILSCALH